MKNTKLCYRVISFIIATILILSSIQMVLYANNYVNTDDILNADYDDYEQEIEIKKQYFSKFEVVSLREENVKHFAKSDGTYECIVYPFPIHELDNNNRWVNIDKSLKEDQKRINRTTQYSWISPYSYEDTYIDSANTNSNYYDSEELYVGTPTKTAYIMLTHPSLPDNATIVSSDLEIEYFYPTGITSGYVTIGIYEVISAWSHNTLTYSNYISGSYGALSQTPGVTMNIYATNSSTRINPETGVLPITQFVTDWYAGKTNYGIAIKYEGGTNTSFGFISGDDLLYPLFIIDYTLDDLPIENGTYFIKNANNGKIVNVNTTINQSQVVISTHSTPNSVYQWTVTYLHNGYYKISLDDSSLQNNDAVLSVKINNETTINGEIVIESIFDGDYRQQWDISHITSTGSYMLKARSSEALSQTNLVLGLASAGYLCQTIPSSRTYCDWAFVSLLPTSGYERTESYISNYWSSTDVVYSCNCYAYALNNQLDKNGNLLDHNNNGQQPGDFANIVNIDDLWTSDELKNNIEADFTSFGNVYIDEIDKNAVCQTGRYKIALYLTSYDYHFYVQDADGYWSHKDGTSSVSRLDENDNLIIDPDFAVLVAGQTLVAFYEITPWNNLYNPGN